MKIPPLHRQPLSSAWRGSRSDCWHGQKHRVCFIVWLQLQWSSIGLLDKCPQTPSTTWIAYPFSVFLGPSFCHSCTSLSFPWERQPAPNYFFLMSLSFSISTPEFVISVTASWVISALRAIIGIGYQAYWPGKVLVPRVSPVLRSSYSCGSSLLTHVLLNHLQERASPHSTVCSFCQLLTIFPLTSSFPRVTFTLTSISSYTLSG